MWYVKEFLFLDRLYPLLKTCNVYDIKKEDIKLRNKELIHSECDKKNNKNINAIKNLLHYGVNHLENIMIGVLKTYIYGIIISFNNIQISKL